jgi:hypothetical protein
MLLNKGESCLAEVAPTLPSADVPEFLSDWNLTFVPSSQSSALLAGWPRHRRSTDQTIRPFAATF